MAWFVSPLEKKGPDGLGCGVWHLCASSDEGGGFVPGCSHDHRSAEEAQDCEDALFKLGTVTGFPYTPKADRAAKEAAKALALSKLSKSDRRALGV